MDTAAFYFAVSAISRRFHRPRMIDRNNYTRDTIHVPNNGIAVVCHGEKRKKKKRKKKYLSITKQIRVCSILFPFEESDVDEESFFSEQRDSTHK